MAWGYGGTKDTGAHTVFPLASIPARDGLTPVDMTPFLDPLLDTPF
jgi:hypothetical protein